MKLFHHLFAIAFVALIQAFSANIAHAQEQVDLLTGLQKLEQILPKEVTTSRELVRQSLSFDAQKPYAIQIIQTIAGKKSDEVRVGAVNLGLVYRASLISNERDRLPVRLNTGGTASIAVREDAREPDYESSFDILSSSVENAREMEALLNSILPLAKAAWEKSAALPADGMALQRFIAERVHDVSAGNSSYVQKLEFNNTLGEAKLGIGGASNRDRQTNYSFAMGDLQSRITKIVVRAGLIELILPTRKGREFVQEEVNYNGQVSTKFNDELKLYFDNYDDALLVNEALSRLIPLAQAESEKQLPSYPDVQSAASALQTLVEQNKLSKDSQSFSGSCEGKLIVIEREGTKHENVYDFDFTDLDPNRLELSPKGDAIMLKMRVKEGEKYIARLEDGLPTGFEDDMQIAFAKPIHAERAMKAVARLAESCQQSGKLPSSSELLELGTVKKYAVNENEQTFEAVDGSKCSYQLRYLDRGRSKTQETLSTFNPADLDPRSVDIVARGNMLELSYRTHRSERLIQLLSSEGEVSYADKLVFRFDSVREAKYFALGIESLAKSCK